MGARILQEAEWTMPFEGEEHYATIVELPFRKDVWRQNATPAARAFATVIKAIAGFEKVIAIADPRALAQNRTAFAPICLDSNIAVVALPYNDSWARDNLPVFVRDSQGAVGAVDFGFNAWGGKFNGLYADWALDNALGKSLLKGPLAMPVQSHKDFILEGGSIHTNGKGTLLTTEECLLSPGRNPGLSQAQIETELKTTLGQRKVIWLPYGVFNDETSGHVDNMACFLDETHVLLAYPTDTSDPQWARSEADLKVLEKATTADGKKLSVLKMPLPGPLFATAAEAAGLEYDALGSKPRQAGDRLAASYVNFYMGSRFIIMPSFGVPEDRKAQEILQDFFRESKKIITVPGREILLGGGNIHCITKQIPAGTIKAAAA